VNWLASRVRLRIRSLSEILDLGFVFFAENRTAYAWLGLSTLLVPFGVCAALQLARAPWWQIWCVAVVLGTLSEGAFTAAAGQLLFAERVKVRRMLAPFGRRLVAYVSAHIVRATVVLICAAFVIPLPAIAARTVFVTEYCLLESASPTACLSRGGQLMQGQAAAGALFALALLLARVAFVLASEALGQSAVEFVLQLGRPLGSLFNEGGSTFALAGFFVSIPYVASTRFLGYVDARTRREGWDIQVRFAALAQREASEEAAA
jgi:hypothetical protein